MENKQTAIEWLFEKITQNEEIRWRGTRYLQLFEQAKQIEKEQMEESYNEGQDFSTYVTDEIYGGVEYWEKEPMAFEQYYKEKYGE